MHSKLSHSPSFNDKFIDYNSWIINLLLDVLVCNIAVLLSKYSTTRKNVQ